MAISQSLTDSPFHYSIATRIRNSYILNFLKPRQGEKILDLGCGVGYFSQLLSSKGSKVFGLDISEESIEYCKSIIGPEFLVGDAQLPLPYDDDFFDKLLCTEVLEHLKDDVSCLKEIYRVVKPGGSFVLTVPSLEGVFGTKIKNILHDHDDGPEKHEREGYVMRECVELVRNCGFDVVKQKYTMSVFVELLMGATKIAYGKKNNVDHLDSQKDVLSVSSSIVFKVYKWFFPLLLIIGKLDDILFNRVFKGHMIVLQLEKPRLSDGT